MRDYPTPWDRYNAKRKAWAVASVIAWVATFAALGVLLAWRM